jgi:light-regulated signal transduction histidine kinase (bacteriophytochrome)
MNKLIDDLLNMSRVSKAEMKFETVNLSQIATKIAQKLKETEPQRSVSFIIADGLSSNGVGSLLEILLDNIIRNAWKFSSKKPQTIIEFGITEYEGKSVYFVKDNGAGFDMKYIDKLFTPFQRLHSMSEFQGTGLGLTIVRRIIARHGGNVWIEGELDKGTTVYFYI